MKSEQPMSGRQIYDDLDKDLPNGLKRDVLVGMATERALHTARDAGVEVIRVLEVANGRTITVMSADLRPARLTLFVEAGVVMGASFG